MSGVVTAPDAGIGLLSGPAIGGALFMALAGRLPCLPRRPPSMVAARSAYLLGVAAFEELIWRALALGLLSHATGPFAALALTSVAFAFVHRHALGRASTVHLVTGVGFGTAFLLGGLAAAVLAHALYNLLVDFTVQAEGLQRSRSP